MTTPQYADIRAAVAALAGRMIEGWGLDGISIRDDTRLSEDLCFSSVDLLNFLAGIDTHFRIRLPYERLLMEGSEWRRELTLGELSIFIHENFDTMPPQVRAM